KFSNSTTTKNTTCRKSPTNCSSPNPGYPGFTPAHSNSSPNSSPALSSNSNPPYRFLISRLYHKKASRKPGSPANWRLFLPAILLPPEITSPAQPRNDLHHPLKFIRPQI